MEYFDEPLGKKGKIISCAALGLVGLATMLAILVEAREWQDVYAYIIPAFLGAAMSSLHLKVFFGQKGFYGLVAAALGAPIVTTVGAIYGGVAFSLIMFVRENTLVLEALIYAPFVCMWIVWAIIAESWKVAVVWATSMGALHAVVRFLRIRQL